MLVDASQMVASPRTIVARIVKSAAHTNPGDLDPRRHRRDFAMLAGLITARDFASEQLSKKDRQLLRGMVTAVEKDTDLLLEVPDASPRSTASESQRT